MSVMNWLVGYMSVWVYCTCTCTYTHTHTHTHVRGHMHIPGAHEPPKTAKKHATKFHDNPNYVTHFLKFSDFF